MSQSQKQSAKERLAVAKKLDDADKTITAIKEIINEYPRFIFGLIELGLAYRLKGDRPSALKTFETALKLNPNYPKTRLELSTEQLYLNKIEDCRENLEKLLKLAPKNVRAIVKLGIVYRKKNNKPQALKLFSQALQLNPKFLMASINLAEELQGLGRHEEASVHLTKALDYAPNNSKLLIELGVTESRRQRLDIALSYFQKAIAHEPENIRPYICQINTLWNLGRFDEAKNSLKILQIKYPDNFAVLVRSGLLARKLGEREKALKWFKLAHAKALNPAQDLKSNTLVAEELEALNRLDEALELINATINKFPDDLNSLMIKGKILQKNNNLNEAANLYQSILSIESLHSDSRLELAKLYSQSGQVEKAILFLEETNQLLGNNIKTLVLLGSFNQALENWQIAVYWYQKVCQEYPEHPSGYCKLANLMFLQGDSGAAIELLQKAQVKLPHIPQIALDLIELQIRLGNLDLSKQLLIKKLERFPYDIKFLWQFCRLQTKRGEYSAAHEILDRISTDNPECLRLTEQLRTTIYFAQYDYKEAEKHIRKAIALSPGTVPPRIRLASLLSFTGRIGEAHNELKIATEKLVLKISASKSTVPLKNSTALVIQPTPYSSADDE